MLGRRLSADGASITTTGSSPNSSNIVPQLFFQFQGRYYASAYKFRILTSFPATDLFLTTLPSSNATVNLTVSSNGTSVSRLFNSTLGMASIIQLPENAVSQLAITFVPSNVFNAIRSPGNRYNYPAKRVCCLICSCSLAVLTIDRQNNHVYPSHPTLPPSISLPSFTTPTSTSSTSSSTTPTSTALSTGSAKRKRIAEAVGLTVGLGLGLTFLLSGAFYYWKRQRRHPDNDTLRNPHAEWTRTGV